MNVSPDIKLLIDNILEDRDDLKKTHISPKLMNYIIQKLFTELGENLMYFSPIDDIVLSNCSNEQIVSIVLSFFEQLGAPFYKQVLDYVLQQNGELHISEYQSKNGFCYLNPYIYVKQQKFYFTKPLTRIEIKKENTLLDVYNLAHELSHSFEFDLNQHIQSSLVNF